MKAVYIDTCIFEANNFFESKRIKQILKLAEDSHISLICPTITYKEISSRGRKNISDAFSKFKDYRNSMRSLRNIPSLENRFQSPKLGEIKEEFEEVLKSTFTKAKVQFLEYPTINIGDVFERYFKNEFPFNKGDKKHEFPDAFALITVEEWCHKNNKTCIVLTNDKDLLHYQSDKLIIPDSYERFLDNLLIEVETKEKRQSRLTRAQELYLTSKERLERSVKDEIYAQLDDISLYYDYFGHNVEDYYVSSVNVSLGEYQYISISEIYLEIEAYADVHFESIINLYDLDSGYYDSETKEWTYSDIYTESIESDQKLPVTFRIYIPLAGDVFMDIELNEVNNGRGVYLPNN